VCKKREKKKSLRVLCLIYSLPPVYGQQGDWGLGSRLIFLSIGRYFCSTGYIECSQRGGRAHLAPDSRGPL
jgi:hypothetical protein